MNRKPWNQYWMEIAWAVSERATCPRKSVGCVLVRQDNSIVSTGYNGAPPGEPHCTDVGCDLDDGCQRVIHAEHNAVDFMYQYIRNFVSGKIGNLKAYVTCLPCEGCFYCLQRNCVTEIYYDEEYRNQDVKDLAKEFGIKLKRISLKDKS